ncbi:MAG: DUF2169 domain-containing protein [Polyangiaceae bacterium]|nr:DUF2169 domain-containing protein [Polyangiaceae bacterium]
MKLIKSSRLAALTRVVEHLGRRRLVVSVAVLFGLEAPQPLLPEVSLWKLVASELGEGAVLDEWLGKARGEFVVTGKAFARGPAGARAMRVRVRVGAVEKELAVLGDRVWRRTLSGREATEPEPFTEMPITWERAFGGEGFEANPLGLGFGPLSRERDGEKVHPLPNIEDPRRLVASPGDRPAPAGFGAYPLAWPERSQKLGTYGAKWLKDRYPAFADDLEPTFFNVAPEDQWIEGFFRGDEELRVEGMHPDKAVVEGRLPGVRARAFVNLRRAGDGGGLDLSEVVLACETVHIFPGKCAGIVIFRGTTGVREHDASDVAHLVCGLEELGAPKDKKHYAAILDKRIDAKKGALHSLRDRDLMPESRPRAGATTVHALESFSDMDELVKTKGLMKANMRRGAQRRAAAAQATLASHDLDPADFKLPSFEEEEEPLPAIEDLADFVEAQEKRADAMKADGEKAQADKEAEARALCAEHGVDYDTMMAEGKKQGAGPPKLKADEKLQELRDMATLARNAGVDATELDAMADDPDLVEALRDGEQKHLELYRKFAHMFPEAPRLDAERAAALREEVLRAHAAGESFADRDLTGADLSNAELRGARLGNAFLESALLAGADLTDADLRGTVLARADLSGAKLAGATLEDANLGAADLTDAELTGAVLTGATLMKANLTRATLAGARLERANLFEAALGGADLSRAHLPQTAFIRVELTGVKLAGAHLTKATFLECGLSGVDFSGADLTKATFVTCRADGASFRGATLEGTSFPKDTSLEGADFTGARMLGANLRGVRAHGADFSRATADSSDFSEADLTEAKLTRARAQGALFIGADLRRADLTECDLTRALLQRANIRGADFARANLFRADLAYIEGDRGTSFEGAFLAQIRFVERPAPEGPSP